MEEYTFKFQDVVSNLIQCYFIDGIRDVRRLMFGEGSGGTTGSGNRRWAPDLLIIVTDGSPNVNVRRTVYEATKAKEQVRSNVLHFTDTHITRVERC